MNEPLDPRVATALLGTYLVRRVPCGCVKCRLFDEAHAKMRTELPTAVFVHVCYRRVWA